ncbi:MAG: DnaJ domain-containing protein [Planctomycetaceae bacterium]|nr:J domain-containing protein [Planctomycetaceae bacterium]
MSSSPDLYMQWLALPPGPRPPDHYVLLGLPRGCGDAERIEAAVRRQMDRLDAYALHPDAQKRQSVQEMMNRLAQARGCLIDPRRRKAYDLAQGITPASAPPAPAIAKAPPSPTTAPATAAQPTPPAIEAPLQISPRETLREFESRVRGHLQKWKLDPHEEMLLMAEAALLGMDETKARATIHRVGGVRTRRVRRGSWRLKKWLLGIIAAETLVVLAMPTARDISDRLDENEALRHENEQLTAEITRLTGKPPAIAPVPPQKPAPAPAPARAPRKRHR